MKNKLETFRALLEAEHIKGLLAKGYDPTIGNHTCTVKIGRKYANVDVGGSGRYMVDLATGEIFGIKAYGVIHRGHYFGTLDTINDYHWSEYHAITKQVAA